MLSVGLSCGQVSALATQHFSLDWPRSDARTRTTAVVTFVGLELCVRFTYIRSKDGRSKDKRSNDQRPKDKRSNDRTSKDKRSKNTEHRMTKRRIGPNVENVQYFFTIINF